MAAGTTAAVNIQHVAGATITTAAPGATMAITMAQTAAMQSIKMLAAMTKKSLAAIRKQLMIAAQHIATTHMHAYATTKIAVAGLICM